MNRDEIKYQVFWKDGSEAYCSANTSRLWLGGAHISLAIFGTRKAAINAIKRTVKETKNNILVHYDKDFYIAEVAIILLKGKGGFYA